MLKQPFQQSSPRSAEVAWASPTLIGATALSEAQLLTIARRLEQVLRRLGLSAESAFYAVALAYASDAAVELGDAARSNSRALETVLNDGEGRELLAQLVDFDVGAEALPIVYQHFVGTKFRRGSGMYFTPRAVAASMVRLLPRQAGSTILDPSCGGGTFLTEASAFFADRQCRLLANDVEPSLADLTRIRLARGAGNRQSEVSEGNIFAPKTLIRWRSSADAIVANPPFSLRITAPGFSSPLFDRGYNTSDSLFLDLAHELLVEGGRLVCLLPHSLFSNSDYAEFRRAVEERFDLLAVIGLPEGVFFTTADTSTRAGIVVLEKRSLAGGVGRRESVYAHAASVGVPLKSRDTNPRNELAEIVSTDGVREVLGLEAL